MEEGKIRPRRDGRFISSLTLVGEFEVVRVKAVARNERRRRQPCLARVNRIWRHQDGSFLLTFCTSPRPGLCSPPARLEKAWRTLSIAGMTRQGLPILSQNQTSYPPLICQKRSIFPSYLLYTRSFNFTLHTVDHSSYQTSDTNFNPQIAGSLMCLWWMVCVLLATCLLH